MARNQIGTLATEFWHANIVLLRDSDFGDESAMVAARDAFDSARDAMVIRQHRGIDALDATAEALIAIADVYAIADGQV